MTRIPVLLGFCLAVTTVQAQTLTREQTITEVSTKIAKIQEPLAQTYIKFRDGKATTSLLQQAVQSALETTMELRDSLSTNPYVRVAGFSVGFPAGVSVELEFPPAEAK